MNSAVSKLYKKNGFTLIEVLVGILVAALGVVGVVQMQKHFIKAGNESNAHLIAMQLVKEQIENIKATDGFTTIVSGNDNAAIVRNNYSFSRSWAVVDRYYDSDNNVWANVADDESVDAKNVKVTVSWSDIDGDTQSVFQSETISRVSIHDSNVATNDITDRTTPQVPYAELNSIENPKITLVDDSMTFDGDVQTKETSKPVPTVDARDNKNLIQFETVTYDSSTDKQTLEDFVTVNCSCSFNGTGDGKTPTILRIADDGDGLVNDESSGKIVDKVIGKVNGTSDFSLCTECCVNHHDSDDSSVKYVQGTSSGNHPHYNDRLQLVTTGDYEEACRFRRVDGFYELVPDWALIDMLIMEKSFFFDDDNVDAYTSYVKSVVKAVTNNPTGYTLPSKPALLENDINDLASGTHQLIARGIYVDSASLSSSDLSTVQSYVTAKANWLEFMPFYEINLSLFANWSSSDIGVVSVTNEAIDTIVDPVNDYYGTYSRGWMTINGSTTETATITATANTDNTGITGSPSIVPGTPKSDSIVLTIDDMPADSVGDKSILLTVNCVKKKQNGSIASCTGQDGSEVDVENTMSLTCSYSSPNISCNNVPDDANGSLIISQAGYLFAVENTSLSLEENVLAARATDLSVAIDMSTVDPQYTANIIMFKQ